MQVWVSCSSIRLVAAPSGRSAEEEVFKDEAEDKEEAYTDEEYQELEEAFRIINLELQKITNSF